MLLNICVRKLIQRDDMLVIQLFKFQKYLASKNTMETFDKGNDAIEDIRETINETLDRGADIIEDINENVKDIGNGTDVIEYISRDDVVSSFSVLYQGFIDAYF